MIEDQLDPQVRSDRKDLLVFEVIPDWLDRKDLPDRKEMLVHKELLALLAQEENLAIQVHPGLLVFLVFRETRAILAFLEKKEQVRFEI